MKVISSLVLLALYTGSSFAQTDCRSSKTQDCFFTAMSIPQGAEKINIGSLYFKGNGSFNGNDQAGVAMSSTDSHHVYLYSRKTGEASKPIAIVKAQGTDGESFTVQMDPALKIKVSSTVKEIYKYCRKSGFGNFNITASKDVSTATLKWQDGRSIIGQDESITLRKESNFADISSVPVKDCPKPL
jgi:hypothetical protein